MTRYTREELAVEPAPFDGGARGDMRPGTEHAAGGPIDRLAASEQALGLVCDDLGTLAGLAGLAFAGLHVAGLPHGGRAAFLKEVERYQACYPPPRESFEVDAFRQKVDRLCAALRALKEEVEDVRLVLLERSLS